MFPRNTIMGQVLDEVTTNKKNRKYMEMIDDLLLDITTNDYLDYNGPVWNKYGLTITDEDVSMADTFVIDPRWTYLETAYTTEYSWLVYALSEIYDPSPKTSIRLFSTIGYLMYVYSEKYDHIEDVLKMTAMISVVWLHPDHLQQDQFMVHPLNLPDFGSEF